MSEQEARKAAEQHCVEHLDGDCCEIAQYMWHAALAWLRSQGEPVAWLVGRTLAYADYAKAVATAQANMLPIQSLYLAPGAKVPEGWKLVPKEPTPEMCAAATEQGHYDNRRGTVTVSSNIYRAMLAAAPEYKEE